MAMTNNVKTIKVKASGEYEVIIGSGIIIKAGQLIKEVLPVCKIALITDDTVDALYSATVEKSLSENGFSVVKYVFPHGEQSKNVNTYVSILNFLAKNQLTRTDAIVALGGGVVGDMAGFASATYLRGIKYVQIPTTLLAQIDSSVGGKTAIDLEEGKNLVGAFCQPALVICDTDALKTLDKDIFYDGMGESAKYALLDQKIFDLLSGEYCLNDLVYLCVDYKRKVVEKDEFESGERRLLNLGHTPAHGIERLSNYTIPHGKAVAMGLDIIVKSSLKHGFIKKEEYDKIYLVIRKCVPENICPYTIEQICEASKTDKKRSGNSITLITVHGVGKCLPTKISVSDMAEYLK